MRALIKKRLLSAAGLILFIALLAYCGPKTSHDSLQPLSVCYGGSEGLPFLIANELGLFNEEGLNVKLIKNSIGAKSFEAMLRGECDMAASGELAVVMNSFERNDFSILTSTAEFDDNSRILANRAVKIEKPADLKGKRIFFFRNSSHHFFIEKYLNKIGIASNEVTFISEGARDPSEVFKFRLADAFVGSDFVIRKARMELGADAVLFSAPGLCMNTYNVSATDRYISAHPQSVRKTLAVIIKAVDFMQKRPDDAAGALAKAASMKKEEAAAILKNYRWRVGLSQGLLLTLENEAEWAIRNKITSGKRVPNYLDYINYEHLSSLSSSAVTLIR